MLRILLQFSIQVLKRNNFPMIQAYPSMKTRLHLEKEFIKTSLGKIPCISCRFEKDIVHRKESNKKNKTNST